MKTERKQIGYDPPEACKEERWYTKKWIRILAGFLAVTLLVSELMVRRLQSQPEIPITERVQQAVLDEDIAQVLRNPIEMVNAAKEASSKQEKLLKKWDLLEQNIIDKKYESAINLLDELISEIKPTGEELTELNMTRTALCFSNEDFDQALQGCTELIDGGYSEAGYYEFMRSVCYLYKQQYQESKADLLDAVKMGYENPSLCYIHLAFCDNYLEDYKAVLEDIGKVDREKVDPVYNETLLYLSAVSCLKLEKFDESIVYLGDLLKTEQYQTSGELYYYRGVCYLSEENYQKALDDFDEAVRFGEETTVLAYNRGVALLGLNRTDDAVREFKKVVQADDEEELRETAKDIIIMMKNSSEKKTEKAVEKIEEKQS